MENGLVSLRDTKGAEQLTISRKEPIFTLAWAPASAVSSAGAGKGKEGKSDKVSLLEERELLAVG